ncbi:anti-sigma factor [Hoeflea sp.]|uniref:anti-sigma factor family protein n=1 Tax=Hoeflea sp. TaxID=1940281 RepID=UPI0019AC59D1|nr:anti-sigma factor [Hoeflea sp.]MBC7282376.1 anti-sigma factor [Hoeflea sp.]
MTDLSIRLSAYLDGELEAADALAIEALLEADPAAQAELEALMAADAMAQDQFATLLNDPVPLALAQKIKSSPMGTPAARPASRMMGGALAAGLALFILGGAGGYLLNDQLAPNGSEVARAGWLSDIADYHAIYADQQRHLVEVAAEEADHIEKWLGATVGVAFSIPDLSQFGLTFEGGRLLVAAGKPVAQLMYRLEDGTVIALCLQSSAGAPPAPEFQQQTIKGFDFVSWKADGAAYVVIGPGGQPGLTEIAALAAREV